jgi:predicted dehydrogenase
MAASTELWTRRQLLRRAGAVLAAPYVVPRTLLGDPQRAAPSERLAVGIIGVKKMGGEHVTTLLGFPDVQLVAVCDVDRRAREVAKQKIERHYAGVKRDGRYGGCADYNDYERLLERPDIDAVVIAVPDHWHAMIAIDACRAGKDVYCEKPLSLTIREAREMVLAARRYERVFQTGTQQRSDPKFRHACELVRNGYIGEPKTVHVECGPPSWHIELPELPVPEGFDYERWLGPAPWAPYHPLRCGSNYWDGWRRFRDYSGGKMTDWGAHHFDIAQWGLGMDESGPVEITPPPKRGDTVSYDKLPLEGAGGTPRDPSWGLTFRYASGVQVVKDGTNGIRFEGTDGWVEVNRGFLKTFPASLATQPIGAGDVHLHRSDHHHQNWLDCIRTRRRPAADVAIGCRSVTVCHLGAIAMWLGRPIRWDPQREEIIGDEQAARWLDRPKRAPYRLNA